MAGTPAQQQQAVVEAEVAKAGFEAGVTEALPPTEPAKEPTTQQRLFTEAELQKVRADEKAKVYGELQASQQALTKYQAEEAARNKAVADAEAKAQADAKAAREAEMDAKQLLQAKDAEWQQRQQETVQEWESRFAQINAEREQERALAAKEREFHAFQQYRAERLAAETGNIAPELIDLVSGNTQEELDASIERLKTKSEQIAQTVQHYAAQARAGQRGVSAASYPATGPDVENPVGQQVTAQDIADMSIEQYAAFRQKAGIGSSQSNKGLFG